MASEAPNSSADKAMASADSKTAEPPLVQPPRGPPVDESALLTGYKLAITFACMMLALFTIALDQTILATALPSIGKTFNSFTEQGWITSSFVLTQSGTVLLFGAVCRIHVAKWVLLGSLAVFEVGSLIAAVSPSVYVLIFGRALSGVGAAGLFASLITTMAQITTLEQRPKLFGMFGAVFALASVIGPLMGGAFTDNSSLTWRWCFYINLPFGGIAASAIIFMLKASPPLGWKGPDRSTRALWKATLRLDWIGAFIFLGATVLLVLALEWAGSTKPWGSPAVICCLVFAFVTYGIFILWERYAGDKAMVPPAILKSWSIYAILLFCFFTRFAFLLATYYIPLYYQAVRGYSAVKSAVNLFPLVTFTVATLIIGGQLLSRFIHHYKYLLLFGPIWQIVGGALLQLITPTIDNANIIGFQIIIAVGVGMTLQNSNLALQAEFKSTPHLIAQASALGMMSQFLGGTISLALGETVLSSEIGHYLAQYAPGVDATTVLQDPLAIRDLPASEVAGAIQAYMSSLRVVYVLMPVAAGIAFIVAFFIQDIRIDSTPKKVKPAKKAESVSSDIEANKSGDVSSALERGDSVEPKAASLEEAESTLPSTAATEKL